MTSAKRVGVIGLGSMGYGIAQSLIRAGFATHGADITAERVARLISEGGQADALPDVAETLDALVVVVLNATQTESVLFGAARVAPALRAGVPVIACPTVPP
ncbi:MAG: NAD(P)-binding domain-containing protein, partial [Pseudomonadota bacterium]